MTSFSTRRGNDWSWEKLSKTARWFFLFSKKKVDDFNFQKNIELIWYARPDTAGPKLSDYNKVGFSEEQGQEMKVCFLDLFRELLRIHNFSRKVYKKGYPWTVQGSFFENTKNSNSRNFSRTRWALRAKCVRGVICSSTNKRESTWMKSRGLATSWNWRYVSMFYLNKNRSAFLWVWKWGISLKFSWTFPNSSPFFWTLIFKVIIWNFTKLRTILCLRA